jgi:cystathionine beta-lyase
MKFRLAPEIKSAVVAQGESGTFGYAPPPAIGEYTASVKRWMQSRHGWDIDQTWITESYGLVAGLGCAVRAITREGDGILVSYPSYGPFPRTVLANRRNLVRTDLINRNGRWEMDFDDMEKKLADPKVKAYILCSPHNPTGRVWTREELERLGDMCLRHGVKVISDEIHFDLVFAPNKHTVFAGISPELADITVTLTAPSKTFNIAGMTISNIIVSNPEMRESVFGEVSLAMGAYINSFGLAACRAAYDSGEKWLEELLPVLDGNAKLMRKFFAEKLPTVHMNRQEGTYLCWVDYSGFGLDEGALDELINTKARFTSQHGRDFGEGYEQFHRVNVACPKIYLEKALHRLEVAAKEEGLV